MKRSQKKVTWEIIFDWKAIFLILVFIFPSFRKDVIDTLCKAIVETSVSTESVKSDSSKDLRDFFSQFTWYKSE